MRATVLAALCVLGAFSAQAASTMTLMLPAGGASAVVISSGADGTAPLIVNSTTTYAFDSTVGVQDYIVSAAPASGYLFAGWVIPGPMSNNVVFTPNAFAASATMTITNLTSSFLLEPTFSRSQVQLILTSDGHELSVTASGSGLVNVTGGLGTNLCYLGGAVQLTANAAANYRFYEWQDVINGVPSGLPSSHVTGNGTNPVATVVMDTGYSLKAVFKQTCTITQINPGGPASGTSVGPAVDVGSTPTVISTVPTTNSWTIINARYFCTGFTAGPDLPASGVGNVCSTLTPLTGNNTVTWNWKTQLFVSVAVTKGAGGGTISGSATMTTLDGGSTYTGYMDAFTILTLTAQAGQSGTNTYHFGGWNLNNAVGVTLVSGSLSSNVIHVSVAPGSTGNIEAQFQVDSLWGANGLPLWFDQITGLNPDADINDPISGKNADPDGDGVSNWNEYLASTNGVYSDPLNWDSPTSILNQGDGINMYGGVADGIDDGWRYHYFNTEATSSNLVYVDVVSLGGRYGINGNPRNVYLWDTSTGYEMTNQPLTNLKRYIGPDGKPPYQVLVVPPGSNYVNRSGATVLNTLSRNIYFAQQVAADTKDQSDPTKISTMGDGFDDGFKYSWDAWQMAHTMPPLSTSTFLANTNLWPGITETVFQTWDWWTDPTGGTSRPFKPNRSSANVGNLGQGYFYSTRPPNPATGYILPGSPLNAIDAYQASVVYTSTNVLYQVIRQNPPRNTTGRWCTNPFLWDTDNDGMPDGWELTFGYDPWSKNSKSLTIADSDYSAVSDGVTHKTFAFDGTNRNTAIYYAFQYDPRTATVAPPAFEPLDAPTKLPASPNTQRFSNYQQILCDNLKRLTGVVAPGTDTMLNVAGMTLASQTTLGTNGWRTVNPNTVDTDGDGMYDGWELYVTLDPLVATDAGADPDKDGLTNFQEFDSARTPPGDSNGTYHVSDWYNKSMPTDPFNADTDGDQLYDGQEKGFFNIGTNATSMVNGGLDPCTVDTDGDGLPDGWEAFYGGHNTNSVNGTISDALLDADGDGLLNYQEYLTGFVYMWQYQHVDPRMSTNTSVTLDYVVTCFGTNDYGVFGAHDPYDFIATSNSVAIYNSQNTNSASPLVVSNQFGLQPHTWDAHYWAVDPKARFMGVPYTFLAGYIDRPAINVPQYATCDPGNADTDGDGMDDFWEVYHGLDPLFGWIDVVQSSFGSAGGNPANYAMGADPYIDQFGGDISSSQPDLRKYPWIAGWPLTDADQDGLPNIDESMQSDPFAPPTYHTDPSPLWMTDISSSNSWVNQYYWLGNVMGMDSNRNWSGSQYGRWWFWDKQVMTGLSAPSYMFSFEMNEGFDTDHDFLSDRAEVIGYTDGNWTGVTDPLDDISPPKRRALHCDGVNSAARTMWGFIFLDHALQNFTVEAWVRPETGNAGKKQTVIERAGLFPQSGVVGQPVTNELANFRLALDESGVPYVQYNGKENPYSTITAKAPSSFALTPLTWYHMAGVYDGNYDTAGHWIGHLRLYINDVVAADVTSSEIPANGDFTVYGVISNAGPHQVAGIAMPIVVGASDLSPDAQINGMGSLGRVGAPSLYTITQSPVFTNFYHGWVDQVRVWNAARTPDEIQGWMMKRPMRREYTQAALSNNLVYAYTFDNLPDPTVFRKPQGDNSTGIGSFDGIATPPGYSSDWWALAPSRTFVYCGNPYNRLSYNYIPWILDEVSHMPQDQPFDSNVRVTALAPTIVVTTNLVQGSLVVSTNVIAAVTVPNSSNPYGMFYMTAPNEGLEGHPFAGGENLSTQRRVNGGTSSLECYPDLLPCGYAAADDNLPMWDDGSNPHTTATDMGDMDGDGLPDWWEVKYGLDPLSALGDNGANGDPDHDGLNNMAEYLAGTDPHTSNSSEGIGGADGFLDYDHRATTNGLTFGELYTPMDGIPSLWKELYGLNTSVYLANRDGDTDGWDDYAEYMAGTSPIDDTSYPTPSLNLTLWYAGQRVITDLTTADLIIEAYSTPTMDGIPDAITYVAFNDVINAYNPASLDYPLQISINTSSNATTVGHLREGDNWFFAFFDRNGDLNWQPGEPCGYAVYQPLNVSWSDLAVDINLQDAAQGFPRIQWTLPVGAKRSRVRMDWIKPNGTNATLFVSANVLDMTLDAPRNYLTEADVVRYAGANANIRGLYVPTDNLTQRPTYRWSVDFDPLDPTTGALSTYLADTTTNTFVVTWPNISGDQPTIVYPNNETVKDMPMTLEWLEDNDQIPAFQVDICQGSAGGPSVFSQAVRVPYYSDNNGMFHYVFHPQYWSSSFFLPLLDGVYYWRVSPANNASIATVPSPWSRILLNASGAMLPPYTNNASGPYSITADIAYMGKVANHKSSEWEAKATGASTSISGTLARQPVTTGSLTFAVFPTNTSGSVWIRFSDTNANFADLTNVKLVGVPDTTLSGWQAWQSATCTVNYTTGGFTMNFTNTPAATNIVVATYDYHGYPFIVQAFRAGSVPGFSGKPVAQTNLWAKGWFTLYGLSAGAYDLLGFIDQNGNGRLDKTETWGFIRNVVPSSGPGYGEIVSLAVGPSITAQQGRTILLRDVDTDNDKLPDAWEVQQFGSTGLYSGEQSLNGGDSTIWQAYAQGPLDDDPTLTDSNMDGVPDVIADALGFNAHDVPTFSQMDAYLTGYTNTLFTIPSIQTDALGRPMLSWSSPSVDSSWNYQIVYTVQRTTSLIGGTWATVGYVTVPAGTPAMQQTWVDQTAAGIHGCFYRLQVAIMRPASN